MKPIIGLLLAHGIGIGCRLTGVPVPAPPVVVGALLVLAMTVGFVATDGYLQSQPGAAVAPSAEADGALAP